MTEFLEVRDLTVDFLVGSALAARLKGEPPPILKAVDNVSFEVERGETVGIVGESGCGKSTIAKAIVGLAPISSGEIELDGTLLTEKRDRAARRRIQMVFQDPGSSLNPSLTVEKTLAELLTVHKIVSKDEVVERCEELMDLVELPRSMLKAYPKRLSGGQRQRVGIARALALEPEVLIADEAVAALDVSVQAPILNLCNRLKRDLGLTILFISHDLAVVRHISDRVVVVYLGTVVEDGPAEEVFGNPSHPYTKALMAAAPKFGVKKEPGKSALSGEPPSALDLPSGCRFRTRCPLAQDVCAEEEPSLTESPSDHEHIAACHFAWTDARA